MYYFHLGHNVKINKNKQLNDTKSKYRSSKSAYHYISRTLYFSDHKSDIEELEYCDSYHMPLWAADHPDVFWKAADDYEIAGRRTSSHITVALPNELNKDQRIELSERLMHEVCGQYKMPSTIAIHNHVAALDEDSKQPHLHLLFSEKSMMDNVERSAEQFFKQYYPKNPEKGGALKITADVLGLGRHQIHDYRKKTEYIINEFLEKYAPTKIIEINGLNLEVKNQVSCLSNLEYNKKYKTNLKDVPQIPRNILYSKDIEDQEKLEEYKKIIRDIRRHNLNEIYRKDYEAELSKRYQQDYDDNFNHRRSRNHGFGF